MWNNFSFGQRLYSWALVCSLVLSGAAALPNSSRQPYSTPLACFCIHFVYKIPLYELLLGVPFVYRTPVLSHFGSLAQTTYKTQLRENISHDLLYLTHTPMFLVPVHLFPQPAFSLCCSTVWHIMEMQWSFGDQAKGWINEWKGEGIWNQGLPQIPTSADKKLRFLIAHGVTLCTTYVPTSSPVCYIISRSILTANVR